MAALLPQAQANAPVYGDWLLLESDPAMPLATALRQCEGDKLGGVFPKPTLSLQSIAQALLDKWGDRPWRPSEHAAQLDWAFQDAVQTLWASPQAEEAAANPGTTIDTLALGDCPASVPPALLHALQFGLRRLLAGYQGVILEGAHPLWLACLWPQLVQKSPAQHARAEQLADDTLQGIGLQLFPEAALAEGEIPAVPAYLPPDSTLMDWGYYLVQGQAQGQARSPEARWQSPSVTHSASMMARLGRIPWSDALWQDPVGLATQVFGDDPEMPSTLSQLRQALWQTLSRRNWPESYSPWLRAAQQQLPS